MSDGWISMVDGEFRWLMVNADGHWWIPMVDGEFRWSMVNSDGWW